MIGVSKASVCMQVTALGGLEAVITAKKWTEVSYPFQFPPSFTSKSFTLRKMYSRLLHDYEQVYFHRNTGPPTLPPGLLHHPLFSEASYPAFSSPQTLGNTIHAACITLRHQRSLPALLVHPNTLAHTCRTRSYVVLKGTLT